MHTPALSYCYSYTVTQAKVDTRLKVCMCGLQSSSAEEPFLTSHSLHCPSLVLHWLPSFLTIALVPLLITLSTKPPSAYFTHHFSLQCCFYVYLLVLHHLLHPQSAQCSPSCPGPPCHSIPFSFTNIHLLPSDLSLLCMVPPVGVVDSAMQRTSSYGRACIPEPLQPSRYHFPHCLSSSHLFLTLPIAVCC